MQHTHIFKLDPRAHRRGGDPSLLFCPLALALLSLRAGPYQISRHRSLGSAAKKIICPNGVEPGFARMCPDTSALRYSANLRLRLYAERIHRAKLGSSPNHSAASNEAAGFILIEHTAPDICCFWSEALHHRRGLASRKSLGIVIDRDTRWSCPSQIQTATATKLA